MGLQVRSIGRWAVLEIVPAFAVIAVVAAIFGFVSHNFEPRLWAELGFCYAVFTAGISLVRHRRTRRGSA